MDEAPNRLDATLTRLEAMLRDRTVQPIRRLRQAIEHQRARGTFDEDFIMRELERIETRERLSGQAHEVVAQAIDHLADRLMRGAPQKDKP